jgi:hypothetical protein
MNGVNTYVKNRISLLYQHIYHIYTDMIYGHLHVQHEYYNEFTNMDIWSYKEEEPGTKAEGLPPPPTSGGTTARRTGHWAALAA